MENILVPQEIIDNLDIEKLREWFRDKEGWHKSSHSVIHSFVVAVGYDGKPYKDGNLYFRLPHENRVRKIKFKNVNRVFEITYR